MARFWGFVSFGLMGISAVVMNLYFIRYLHMGRFMGRRPWFTRLTVLVFLVTLFTPYFGYAALVYLSLYLFSPLVTWRVDPQEAAREGPLQKASAQWRKHSVLSGPRGASSLPWRKGPAT